MNVSCIGEGAFPHDIQIVEFKENSKLELFDVEWIFDILCCVLMMQKYLGHRFRADKYDDLWTSDFDG